MSNVNVCSYFSDSDLYEVLKEVVLDGLFVCFGGLDVVYDWLDILSLGE